MFDFYNFKEQKQIFGFWKAVYYTLHGLRICQFFRQVIYFAQKLYAYLPIIWYDNDFDYSALLTLMEFKMSRMSKHMLEHDIVVDAPKIGKELRVAAALCRRIREDNYYELPLKKLDEEYGEWTWDSVPTEHPNAHRVILDRANAREGTVEYEKVKGKERKIFAHARTQLETDKEYLFDLMKKKVDHWWC